MNYLYAINFTPGFEELVGRVLISLNAEIVFSEEAFALVKFRVQPKDLDLRFAKSVIQVFGWAKNSKDLKFEVPDGLGFGSSKTFTLRSFEAGRPSKIDTSLRSSLINDISEKTKLRYSAFEPDEDFVLAKRRDGMSYFGLKLKFSEEHKPKAGELGSDVANLLLKLGELRSGGKVLDAFAGYGGISKEVLKSFEPLSLVQVDKDGRTVNNLKSEFKSDSRVQIAASDVVVFLNNTEEKFDLIVADPPWGEFDEFRGDLGKLYADFLASAGSKLKDSGKVVIISSKKEELESAAQSSGMNVEAKLNVLISGKKVLVLKLGYS